jgi:hypothetical protein
MGVLSQFLLLMWKNGKTQLRSPVWTVLETILPVAVVVLMAYLRSQVGVII